MSAAFFISIRLNCIAAKNSISKEWNYYPIPLKYCQQKPTDFPNLCRIPTSFTFYTEKTLFQFYNVFYFSRIFNIIIKIYNKQLRRRKGSLNYETNFPDI